MWHKVHFLTVLAFLPSHIFDILPHTHTTPRDPGGPLAYSALLLTFVQSLGHLAGVSTSIGTTLLNPRAFTVHFTAFDTGGGKATGLLGSWAIPLLNRQDVLEELTAGQAFIVLLGEQRLGENRKKILPLKTHGA